MNELYKSDMSRDQIIQKTFSFIMSNIWRLGRVAYPRFYVTTKCVYHYVLDITELFVKDLQENGDSFPSTYEE